MSNHGKLTNLETIELLQKQLYGCSLRELNLGIEQFKTAPGRTNNDLIMSLLSDAQEEMEWGLTVRAKQTINRAKYILELNGENPVRPMNAGSSLINPDAQIEILIKDEDN